MERGTSLAQAGHLAIGGCLVGTLVGVGLWAIPSLAMSQPPVSPVPAAVARQVRLIPFASGLSEPVGLVAAPGDPATRVFVVEKTGRIRLLLNGKPQPVPFLDLHDQVSRGSEQGLLGLAFHPQYAKNGRFFVNLTDRNGDTRIWGFKATSGQADPKSRQEWLTVAQPYANHNGGNLAFGPDGRLYIGTGDGGSGNDPHGHGQNPTSRLGKMLRLTVDQPPAPPEILQRGLRNPWRYSFDRQTGDLYIADVGQNRYEEVNVVPAGRIGGQNFGWSVVEGMGHCLRGPTCDQRGLTPPVLEYSHDDGCSITGGAVYRGKALPALAGHYLYADFCTGLLRSFRWQQDRVTESWDWKAALDPRGTVTEVSAFGEDSAGELYLLSLKGTIHKFIPAGTP